MQWVGHGVDPEEAQQNKLQMLYQIITMMIIIIIRLKWDLIIHKMKLYFWLYESKHDVGSHNKSKQLWRAMSQYASKYGNIQSYQSYQVSTLLLYLNLTSAVRCPKRRDPSDHSLCWFLSTFFQGSIMRAWTVLVNQTF